MTWLRRWQELSGEERLWLRRAIVHVGLVRLALWVCPFQRIRTYAARIPKRWKPSPAERIAWAVNAAANRIPRATCLTRAVALQILLAKSGQPSRVEIGVAREKEEFGAHAWLVAGGNILVGAAEAGRYRPLFAWDSNPPAEAGKG
jgi:hypothetical protein